MESTMRILLQKQYHDQTDFFFFFYFFHIEKPCALFCSPNGKDQPILVTEKAMDGTSCGPQDQDICANGRCQVNQLSVFILL